jgi:chorismate mutase/prephenate dehydratase
MRKDLRSLRKSIEEIDRKLVSLLKKRVELAEEIGKLKRAEGKPIVHLEREREVLSKVKSEAELLKLSLPDVEAIFREIVGMCRKVQEEIRVAYLGPSGSITEEAAITFFSSIGATFIPCYGISDIFRKVETDEANYGIVPVESSIEGSVTASLDGFLASDLRIRGEVEIPVRLNLILHPDTKVEEVKIILSHPQALAQARHFLDEHFPNVPRKEVGSTAEAVRLLTTMKDAAAIGSESAARLYGMKVEARDVQDVKGAFTRFFILGKEDCELTGDDKTTIIYSVANVPGALYKALEPFAKRNINITRVESRPTKKAPWEYVFFLDFEGHREDPVCKEALEEMKRKTTLLKILGSYPKWSVK